VEEVFWWECFYANTSKSKICMYLCQIAEKLFNLKKYCKEKPLVIGNRNIWRKQSITTNYISFDLTNKALVNKSSVFK